MRSLQQAAGWRNKGMTMGMMLHYGGAVGVAAGIIVLLVLSKVFTNQRRRMRNNIGGRED